MHINVIKNINNLFANFQLPPYRKTSTELRTRALVLMEMGVSCREVSRQLNVNVKTVCQEAPGRDWVGG